MKMIDSVWGAEDIYAPLLVDCDPINNHEISKCISSWMGLFLLYVAQSKYLMTLPYQKP